MPLWCASMNSCSLLFYRWKFIGPSAIYTILPRSPQHASLLGYSIDLQINDYCNIHHCDGNLNLEKVRDTNSQVIFWLYGGGGGWGVGGGGVLPHCNDLIDAHSLSLLAYKFPSPMLHVNLYWMPLPNKWPLSNRNPLWELLQNTRISKKVQNIIQFIQFLAD